MLQVGGTGRVGGMIVRRLSEQGALMCCYRRLPQPATRNAAFTLSADDGVCQVFL
jgi:prephenate dehydrogenase